MLGFLAPAGAQPHSGPPVRSAHPASCDGLPVTHHIHRARVNFAEAYDLDRWDSGPKHSAIHAAQEHRRCIRIDKVRGELSGYRDRKAEAYRSYAAEQRHIAAITPYDCGAHGSFAVPCSIVFRESGYDARAKNTTSTAGGYYQIIDTSWFAYGGVDNGCYHVAACASVDEQHEIAAKMWDGGAGSQHWALTYP